MSSSKNDHDVSSDVDITSLDVDDDVTSLQQCGLFPELSDETVLLLIENQGVAADLSVGEDFGGEMVNDEAKAVVDDKIGETPMDAGELHVDMKNEGSVVVTDVGDAQLDEKGGELMAEKKMIGVAIAEKTEKTLEIDSGKNDVDDELIFRDAEVETETGNEVVGDKILKEVMETDDIRSDSDVSLAVLRGEEDDTVVAVETGTPGTDIETDTEVAELGSSSNGKRKRGKLLKCSTSSKTVTRTSSSRKVVGESECFICLDGGDLFLCDRRGCPKAYHPSCVNRDEAFFRAKGQWNCGWHMCSICEKNARYMCYTCTFSLCSTCIKNEILLCVRGSKGFCESCMTIVKIIENIEQEGENTLIDFDDRSSWEFLFKDYYVGLKANLSLLSVEIAEAKNPWKGSNMLSGPSKREFSEAHPDSNDKRSEPDNNTDNIETVRPKRRKLIKKSKPLSEKEELVIADVAAGDKANSLPNNSEWATKELLEFVSHMKDGDTSFLTQFDVQALLLEYINRNKLRDSRRQSQIICDARLQNLFGKPRVGHYEMLKLLESHFLVSDEPNDDFQGSVVDTENNQLDSDDNTNLQNKGQRRKTRRKSDRVPQSNINDYAAIDMHNISLIFMRRKLIEDLLDDAENFHDKVVGTFVRIRISGGNQKQDLYRLAQVVGTSKATECYKVGKKTTCCMLEILNLNKTEFISIDSVSNQEFTEEECSRLRQSIKCGLISRLTVGDVLEKSMEIQIARVNDWLESEVLRLTHLRDRANDFGHRKELRECVEKIELLKTPEERLRRQKEFPNIHSDPKMDPSYESDENDSETENKRDAVTTSRISGCSSRGKGGMISPGSDHSCMKDSSSGTVNSQSKNVELSRNLSCNSFSVSATNTGDIVNENSQNVGDKDASSESKNIKKLNSATQSESVLRVKSVTSEASLPAVDTSMKKSGSEKILTSEASLPVVDAPMKKSESLKIWRYEDPAGKVQGPFSILQLHRWNKAGYFPADLRIWKVTETKDDSVLLPDALAGKLPIELPSVNTTSPATNKLHNSHTLASMASEKAVNTSSPTTNKLHNSHTLASMASEKAGRSHRPSKWSTEKSTKSDITNLQSPTPTPKQSNATATGGDRSLPTGAIQPAVVNNVLVSPTVVLPAPKSQGSADSLPKSQGSAQTHSQTVQPVISQNLQTGTQGWSGGLQTGQPQGHNWATPNVQGSYGNVSNSGTMAVPTPDCWGNQPNMPPPATPNASWAMGPPPPGNMNSTCWVPWNGVFPSTGNSGAPLVHGSGPVNGWGPPIGNSGASTTQVPMPGNGWVQPTGNSGAPLVQGSGPINGWGPPTGNPGAPALQVPAPGNVCVPPTGNMGAQGNANQGWGAPPLPGNMNQGWGPPPGPGNMGAQGNMNQGWGPAPPGNQGPWNDGQFNRRPFNRNKPCPYNIGRRCIKGSQCNYRH